MPSLIQSSFIGGEWSPHSQGRVDHPLYKHALARARNCVILPRGGATMRPGSRNAGTPGSGAANPIRLKRFSPLTGVVYTIEFGLSYIRFWRNHALVQAGGGGTYQLVTSYAAADLPRLSFTADAATLWIWHPNYVPQQLIWNGGDSNWTFQVAAFTDGPYLAAQGGNTATPGATGGSANVTFASLNGINEGNGFTSGDIGRAIRFLVPTWQYSGTGSIAAAGSGYNVGDLGTVIGGTPLIENGNALATKLQVTTVNGTGGVTGVVTTSYGQYLIAPPASVAISSDSFGSGAQGTLTWAQTGAAVWLSGIIQSVSATNVVNVQLAPMVLDASGTTIGGQFPSTAAISVWRLGAWCNFDGFPGCAAIDQGRLIVAGQAKQAGQPMHIWGSATSAHNNFAPSLATGQVIDSNAFDFDLDADENATIGWLSPAGSAQIPQLGIGSADAEFVLQAGGGGALTPTSVQTYRESRYGAAAVAPYKIGKYLLYIDRSLRRLRQWFYYYFAGGYVGPEAAPQGEHLLLAGVREFDYAQTPHPILWFVTNAGELVALTFVIDEKEPQNTVAAWHAHPLGGSYYGGPPLIDSVCVSPREDGSYDELWLAVLRTTPAGTPYRTIEYLTPYFRAPNTLVPRQPLDQAIFLDNSVSSALTFPNATCTPGLGPFQPSGATVPQRGDSVPFTFSANVAAAGDVVPGTVLRINNGTFRASQYTGPTAIVCECLDPPQSLAPAAANLWSYTRMATSFSGFAALNGLTVSALADGQPYSGIAVSGGTINLPAGAQPASYVTAGLPYTGQLETLDLDLPAQDGTSQMKEGRIDHLYLRVVDTIGIAYGHDDQNLDALAPEFDESGWPPVPISDDLRLAMPEGNAPHRRAVIEQPNPWPMTILALVVKGGTAEQAPR